MVGLSTALLITLGLIASQINVIKTAKKGAEDAAANLEETFNKLKFQQKKTTTLSNSNKLTSEGAQLSKSDRKQAFLKYSQALDSLQQSELLSENELAQRLLNELMAELSISPFYLYEKREKKGGFNRTAPHRRTHAMYSTTAPSNTSPEVMHTGHYTSRGPGHDKRRRIDHDQLSISII